MYLDLISGTLVPDATGLQSSCIYAMFFPWLVARTLASVLSILGYFPSPVGIGIRHNILLVVGYITFFVLVLYIVAVT